MRSSDSSPDDEVKKMLQLISEYELREEDLNKEIENLTDEVMSQVCYAMLWWGVSRSVS